MSIAFKSWLLAARPKTLPASAAPVVLGTALAYAQQAFHAGSAVAALLASLFLQIGVNLANDYFDGINGLDTDDRLGPTRATASGLIAAGQVKKVMIICLGLAALISLYLIARAGWPVAVIGIASVLSALAYSGGPYPLASNGLGDLFSFVFYGPVAVCGTYFVQTLAMSWDIFWMSWPVGLLIAAILVVNNYRDIETDACVGKKTLAVILGPAKARLEFVTLLSGAYAIAALMWLKGDMPATSFLLPLFTLPLALQTIYSIQKQTGTILNKTLAKTAMLALIFSLLQAIGVII